MSRFRQRIAARRRRTIIGRPDNAASLLLQLSRRDLVDAIGAAAER